MICPNCGFAQEDRYTECAKCGVIFEKFRGKKDSIKKPNDPSISNVEGVKSFGSVVRDILFHVSPETNPFSFYGRLIVCIILLIWSCKFILTPMASNYSMESLWHLVNLPFHEAGHLIFRPFGRIIHSLGGSMGQLLMPLICLAALLIKAKDPFGGSFCLWWFGENFIDIAPYLNDARALRLPLVGGNVGHSSPYGFHDWEFILNELGLLRYDHILATISNILGIILMLVSFLWGGFVLFKQYRNLR